VKEKELVLSLAFGKGIFNTPALGKGGRRKETLSKRQEKFAVAQNGDINSEGNNEGNHVLRAPCKTA